jgi:hypothetical protein
MKIKRTKVGGDICEILSSLFLMNPPLVFVKKEEKEPG